MNRRSFLQLVSGAVCGATLGVSMALGPLGSALASARRKNVDVEVCVWLEPPTSDRLLVTVDCVVPVEGPGACYKHFRKTAEVSGAAAWGPAGRPQAESLLIDQLILRLDETRQDVAYATGRDISGITDQISWTVGHGVFRTTQWGTGYDIG